MHTIALIQEAISRYGRTVLLQMEEESCEFTACIIPKRFGTHSDKLDLHKVSGRHDPRFAVYYGPLTQGGKRLQAGCTIQCAEECYRVQIVQDYYLGMQPVYRWAMLIRLDGGDLDGDF